MCLPGHFPISPLNPQRAAPRGLPGPLEQHPGARRPRGPQRCSCCLSGGLLLLARAAGTGNTMSLGALGEMQVNRGFGQAGRLPWRGIPKGPGTRGVLPTLQFGHKEEVLSWAGGAGQWQHPQGSRKQPHLSVFGNGNEGDGSAWLAGSRSQDAISVCTLVCTLICTTAGIPQLRARSSGRDPAVSTGCSVGRRPTGGAPTQPQHPPQPADK